MKYLILALITINALFFPLSGMDWNNPEDVMKFCEKYAETFPDRPPLQIKMYEFPDRTDTEEDSKPSIFDYPSCPPGATGAIGWQSKSWERN